MKSSSVLQLISSSLVLWCTLLLAPGSYDIDSGRSGGGSGILSVNGERGGELRKYWISPFDSNQTSIRQDVCHRYIQYRNGDIELRDALQGLEIRPLMDYGEFFQYDDVDGINRLYPGLLSELMDELAKRAGFTWRQSFGVMDDPSAVNMVSIKNQIFPTPISNSHHSFRMWMPRRQFPPAFPANPNE